MSRVVLAGVAATALVIGFNPLKQSLNSLTNYPPASGWILVGAFVLALAAAFATPVQIALSFAWNCFFKPLGKSANQQGRLDQFYLGQAEIYDKTRNSLLRGRTTMLKLSAAHLKEQRKQDPSKRLVWLDIGGGTGWNVEEMDKYFPIADFDAVYVLDLCAPLLEVSRKRFEARGWENVHCLLQDATTFVLPEWSEEGVDPEGALDFVTMSYSLSMMPNMLALVDRVDRFLSPTGLLSVCDFYVSAREKTSLSEVIGDVASRHCSWLTRLFWLHWFEFDHVDLHPSRRQYLEHTFATIKSFNGRNNFVLPWVIRIPYYVTLMTSRRADTSRATRAYEIDAGNTISVTASPLLVPARQSQLDLPALNIGLSSLSRNPSYRKLHRSNSRESDSTRIDIAPEEQLSSFHYGKRQFRVPYIDSPVHKEFRTWIYGFTWEDPAVDMQHLGLTSEDSVLCITSAGDNALHYAIAGPPGQQPKRIHAVDMNPCQGHLLELKLASICALSFEDHWLLFGEGKHPNFRELLDTKLSPFLTSHAYQFWRKNDQAFASCFYLRGYSGWALRLAKFAIAFGGISKEVKAFCKAPTLAEQTAIWEKKLRPVLLSKWITKLFLANPAFLWNALGVPTNQAQVFLSETTTEQFAIDTLDPVAYGTHVKTGAYHYQVCLEQKYTRESCPEYLTREGFEFLKANNGAKLDCFRLHTDSIINVMKRLGKHSLTVAVIMDLQDWFRNSLSDSPEKTKNGPCDLTLTIRALHHALAPGGRVFWRSAGLKPWYRELYEREGFRVECIHEREIGSKVPIDRVNMYASFYRAIKV
ncbi:hypothetical protein BCR35DRAFT_302535 [Leucosporidium creatinivorum]|uniref:Methyltransferase domain-containing protein n=1 Tax=Leucosporidium creatinivorum TaxID=106004 RepID=A0A1Y2FPL2_9BASI|nr:hypothetical protein BCR35DRAFT_302535 [Leucosporidium creatinivorum]